MERLPLMRYDGWVPDKSLLPDTRHPEASLLNKRGIFIAKAIGWTSFAFLLVVLFIAGVKSPVRTRYASLSVSDYGVENFHISIVGEYAKAKSLIDGFYPWEDVVEPYHTTKLVASGLEAHHSATWTLTCLGDDCEQEVVTLYSATGAASEHIFTKPTQKYEILLTINDDDRIVATVKKEAICKYVRREFREMKPEHTRKFFDALEIIYRNTDLEAGKNIYGNNFVNSKVLTAKHNDDSHCYHNGRMFFTAHGAFDLMLDNALQSIDPSVTLPYWDFTYDGEMYGAEAWKESQLYHEDWFGPVMQEFPYVIDTGRWKNTPVVFDVERKIKNTFHNSYGTLTNQMNNNPSKYLQRTNHFCGMRSSQHYAVCTDLLECMNYNKNLTTWDICLEQKIHGNQHKLHGGAFGCEGDSFTDAMAAHPEWTQDLLSFIGLTLGDGWTLEAHYDAPSECSIDDTPWKDCRGKCAYADQILEMGAEEVYRTLEPYLIQWRSSWYQGADYIKQVSDPEGTNGGRLYAFAGLSADSNDELMRYLLSKFCHTGLLGQAATGASSNDPIFFAFHVFFNRLLHYGRLSKTWNVDMDWTWVDEECSGSKWLDTLPFSDLNVKQQPKGDMYTNEELWDLLAPGREDLPYMYADLKKVGASCMLD